MKNLLLDMAKAGGGMAVARFATRKWLRILCYHGIWTSEGPPHGECLFMVPEQFEQRMRWLAASGYKVLDLDEAIARLNAGTLPDNAVAITIDDGWRTTYTHMLPVLEELGLPSTLYVSTYYVEKQEIVVNVAINHVIERCGLGTLGLDDILPGFGEVALGDRAARGALASRINAALNQHVGLGERVRLMKLIAGRAGVAVDWEGDQFRYLSGAELVDARARGMRIELHTHRHRSVNQADAGLDSEIADNRASLAAMGIGGALNHFCYPSGDYAPEAEAPLAAAGMASATNTSRYLNPPGLHPYRLGRFVDGPRVDQRIFEAYLAGALEIFDRRNRRIFGRGG